LGFFARKRDFDGRMIFGKLIGNNGRTGSGGVFPREPAEAREWAERYLTVAEVEAGFAGAIQDA
jgi:hypothetical protein